jgi:enterobactin synthetase component D
VLVPRPPSVARFGFAAAEPAAELSGRTRARPAPRVRIRPPHPAELAIAAGFNGRRRAEFLLGRRAARAALAAARIKGGPVLVDGRRPVFPPGAVGSISHSGEVAVAIAGPAARYRSIGVDLELYTPPIAGAHLILSDGERAWVQSGTTLAQQERRLLRAFSAKEAAYKALDPVIAGGIPRLRRIRLRPVRGGFIAWAPDRPDLWLRVAVRDLRPGVLSWTALPRRTRARSRGRT